MIRRAITRIMRRIFDDSLLFGIEIMFNFVKQTIFFLAMKRIFFIALVICGLATFNGHAQTDSLETKTTPIENVEQKTIDMDSVTIAQIKAIYDRMENFIPRYKMYKTENVYHLIKLDTATGRVWQVQYRSGNIDSKTTAIDDSSLLWSFEDEVAGRFDLYPTPNMYKFILIDTQYGRTWMIQWNIDSDKRFRERIY